MKPVLDLATTNEEVFRQVEDLLKSMDFRVVDRAPDRPWGGYLVIDSEQAKDFASTFFPETDFGTIQLTGHLSPKILLVGPRHRLSWQYHFRRAEIWRLVAGTAAITTSEDDVERHRRELKMGEVVRLRQGERHRLIGGAGWGMIAEIWQHTDPANLSDEADIVRLQDDYRKIS